jgi:glycerol-3-phosphate dehydrogenase (NAD(P)+)
MAKVSVIGAGGWGIALAKVLSTNGNKVTIWSVLAPEIQMLQEKKEHITKLPGVKLPDEVQYTTALEAAVIGSDLLVMAVPSIYVRNTAKQIKPYLSNGQIIVNVGKGIEEQSLMTLAEIISDELENAEVAVLSGPSHAEEVGRELPTTCVVGAKKRVTAEYIQHLFMNDTFRVYTSPDILGIELGGSLKNVIALAAGMADGLGYGDNTKAALITRGITEIGRLALAMGAKYETLSGLTGIGDLIVTCASVHSRNRLAGFLIGQGKSMEEAMDEVKMVVEGVYSAKAAVRLARKYQVPMPIIEQVNAVLFQGKSVKEAVFELMKRDKKAEYDELLWGKQ